MKKTRILSVLPITQNLQLFHIEKTGNSYYHYDSLKYPTVYYFFCQQKDTKSRECRPRSTLNAGHHLFQTKETDRFPKL